jgi:hypothetical protein
MENIEAVKQAVENRFNCKTYTADSNRTIYLHKKPTGEMTWRYIPESLPDSVKRDVIIDQYLEYYYRGMVHGRELELILIDTEANRKIIEQTFFIPLMLVQGLRRANIWYYSEESKQLLHS